MFWSIVGALLFVFVGLPIVVGAIATPYGAITEWMDHYPDGWRTVVGGFALLVYTGFLLIAGAGILFLVTA
jgi:uncharacterized membrane protein